MDTNEHELGKIPFSFSACPFVDHSFVLLFQDSAAPALPRGSYESETTNLHSLSGTRALFGWPGFLPIEHRCTGLSLLQHSAAGRLPGMATKGTKNTNGALCAFCAFCGYTAFSPSRTRHQKWQNLRFAGKLTCPAANFAISSVVSNRGPRPAFRPPNDRPLRPFYSPCGFSKPLPPLVRN